MLVEAVDHRVFSDSTTRCPPLQPHAILAKACVLLCTKRLIKSKITEAHNYLRLFCDQFQQVNGDSTCTPNMHLHLHLSECLLDYGPVYGFWCIYSFERYNGTLGKYPNNQKHIEPQLMKKCLIDQQLRSSPVSTDYPFHTLLPKSHQETGGCLLSTSSDIVNSIAVLAQP